MVQLKEIDTSSGLGCCMCCVERQEMTDGQIKMEKIRGTVGFVSWAGTDFILTVTTLVLGILGAIGIMRPSTLGWSLIGVAGGKLLTSAANSWNLALTRFSEDKGDSRKTGVVIGITTFASTALLITPAFVFGGLGIGGVMTASAVGWTLFGTTLATVILYHTCTKLIFCSGLSKGWAIKK